MKRSPLMFVPAMLLAILSLFPETASAATNCTATTTPLAFGTVTGARNADFSAIVTVNCSTLGLSLLAVARVRMCLNIGAGANGNGQTVPRRMTNSFGDALQFQIFSDPARTEIWGHTNTPATPTPVPINLQYGVPVLGGIGSAQTSLYGRVPAQGGLAAGNHANPFTGSHTRMDYRYSEQLLLAPPWPASCTSGGDGGGSITFPFTASANVPNNCTISTATNLGFGAVPGLIASNRDQTSSIAMTCTKRTAWNLALSNGQNATGTARRMRLGTSGNYVNYELYRDATRTQRWGAAGDAMPGTGTGAAQTLTVHGRVPAGQAVPAGAYRDVVTVTVTY